MSLYYNPPRKFHLSLDSHAPQRCSGVVTPMQTQSILNCEGDTGAHQRSLTEPAVNVE